MRIHIEDRDFLQKHFPGYLRYFPRTRKVMLEDCKYYRVIELKKSVEETISSLPSIKKRKKDVKQNT
jgi:hypothetical protein